MEENTNIPASDTPKYEVIPLPPQEPVDPSKTGNKPKQLKAIEVYGYEVGRGNRKKVVSPEEIYNLSAIGCTDSEIARWFDIAESTLKYNFSEILAKGREDIKMTLRRAQIQLALNGNATMLIWLGKQLLSQEENPVGTEANQPLPWNDDGTEPSTEDSSQG